MPCCYSFLRTKHILRKNPRLSNQVLTMCNGLVISDLNIQAPMAKITNKTVVEMGQERIQEKKIKNYSKYRAKRVWKIDEDEDYEADFQAFLMDEDEEEEEEGRYKFRALMDSSRRTKEKDGSEFLKKGKDLLTNLCISMCITSIIFELL